ncbi:hypothetical protein [Streptomyces sp. FL07-04A]|uniref:hypothetical protein n=1 Tax=Streptomyces sp. FL07-04A TaxID=3028658 RepID=UPI0029A5FFD3|nr:hypothetical protein [Streptomyces sp. FL07-04A]MDX3579621.1 hypothetical protein [Streptomyces sp. FL07-04A]
MTGRTAPQVSGVSRPLVTIRKRSFGAPLTGMAAVVVTAGWFEEGAWLVVVVLPLPVAASRRRRLRLRLL